MVSSAFLVSRAGEPARGASLARFAGDVRATRTRADLLAVVARAVRAAFAADRVVVCERDAARALAVVANAEASDDGAADGARPPFPVPVEWIERALESGDLVRVDGAAAALIAPVYAEGRFEVAIAVAFRTERAFDDVDLVMLRGIATQVEFALEGRRLADADALRGRRADSLERTMLALREPREARDILAIVARGLAHDFGRPCVAYEFRGEVFVPIVASGTTGPREPIALDRFETELLVAGNVRRDGTRDVVGITANDQLRALLALEGATGALTENDAKYVRAVGTHAGLAISGALAFDQLRRYATEGAALKEAARTILGFTELRPLAVALSRLAARLVRARHAAIYAIEDDELVLLGASSPAVGADVATGDPERLALRAGNGHTVLEQRYRDEPHVVVPLRLSDGGRGGYLVVRRFSGSPFERYERRIVDALVNLAQLAIRNVDLYERSDRANRALAESNGFKDDLLAMFAHDFKGPLTVISGFSELLLEITDDEEIRSNVRTINDQTKRLAKLAEDALALAATQSAGFSLRRELDDLGAFVRECCSVLDPDGARLRLHVPEEPIELLFDRNRLRHVVDNVVGNALKYSAATVTVEVGRDARTSYVEVTDRGIGVPELELGTIFARYGRASNARSRGVSGSGVGLYIAKKIVDVHGGTLTVASVENEGSTFRIALPAARG